MNIEAAEFLRSERMNRSVEATIYFCCFEALKRAENPFQIRLERLGPHVEFSVSGASFDPPVDLGQEILQGWRTVSRRPVEGYKSDTDPGRWSAIHGQVPVDSHKGGTG